jgi:hypothetical protein
MKLFKIFFRVFCTVNHQVHRDFLIILYMLPQRGQFCVLCGLQDDFWLFQYFWNLNGAYLLRGTNRIFTYNSGEFLLQGLVSVYNFSGFPCWSPLSILVLTPAELCLDYSPHTYIGEVAESVWRSSVFVTRDNKCIVTWLTRSKLRSFAQRLRVSLA